MTGMGGLVPTPALDRMAKEGMRFTDAEVLAVARKVFMETNLKIVDKLEELGTNAINILLGSKKNKQFANYLVKPHIIERGSVKSLI